MEASRSAHPGRPGRRSRAFRDRSRAPPDRPVHDPAAHGVYRDRRPHHLHDDDRQEEGDRDPQADRGARSPHRRADRAAGARHGSHQFPGRRRADQCRQGYFPRRVVLEPADARHSVRGGGCRVPAGERARGAHRAQDRSRFGACGVAMAEQPVVEVRGISKHFGEGPTRVDALREVSLDVYPGTVIGLRGPSGSGKSTLLNVIGCILEPNSGSMRLNGELVYDGKWLRADLRGLRLEKIGFIFQSHNLLPFLNAWENVAVARILAGASPAQARSRALELLTYLGIERRADAMPGQLSGGEAQRVAIARALANDPRIILADEPTAALDSQRAGIVMDMLRKVAEEHRTAVIVVTHDEKIFDRFDHIHSLRDGALEAPVREGSDALVRQ